MTEANIVIVETNDGIGTITLNRPERLNALNDELTIKLKDAVTEMEGDAAVKAVIIVGSGRGFSAGADLQSRSIGLNQPTKPSLGNHLRQALNPIALKIRTMEKP